MPRARRLLLPAALALPAVLAAACTSDQAAPAASATPSTSTSSAAPSTSSTPSPTASSGSPGTTALPTRPVTVASGLDVPWGLAFLPDGSALLTLRDRGVVLRVREGSPPVHLGEVPGVQPRGEGGLLGVAVSPDFATDATVFVYLTAAQDNRVLRMTLRGNDLRPDKVIVDGIPVASNHDGGRLEFGPDGYLYIGTGDASDPGTAQDRGSLGGKILRVTRNGSPAPGNPFGSRVWTLGHRNVQGLAWDGQGRMFASEFGQNTWDELNLVEKGRNYGWPEVEGRGGAGGFTDPLAQWATSDASPSGVAVGADGAVYLAALRGESLWRVPVTAAGRAGEPERLLEGEYGRLRTVARGPDGRLWIVTSNTYRGDPRDGDDKVVILPGTLG